MATGRLFTDAVRLTRQISRVRLGCPQKDAGGLELDKGKLALEDWYKKQQIANERARTGIMAQNANREQWGDDARLYRRKRQPCLY